MDNFEPYNVLLSIATNTPVLLMTAFVLQGHNCSKTNTEFNASTSEVTVNDSKIKSNHLFFHKFQ